MNGRNHWSPCNPATLSKQMSTLSTTVLRIQRPFWMFLCVFLVISACFVSICLTRCQRGTGSVRAYAQHSSFIIQPSINQRHHSSFIVHHCLPCLIIDFAFSWRTPFHFQVWPVSENIFFVSFHSISVHPGQKATRHWTELAARMISPTASCKFSMFLDWAFLFVLSGWMLDARFRVVGFFLVAPAIFLVLFPLPWGLGILWVGNRRRHCYGVWPIIFLFFFRFCIKMGYRPGLSTRNQSLKGTVFPM